MDFIESILYKAPPWLKNLAGIFIVSLCLVQGLNWIDGMMATKQTKLREYVDRQDNLHAADAGKRIDDLTMQLSTMRIEINNGFSEIRKTQEDILLRLPRAISLNKSKTIYE